MSFVWRSACGFLVTFLQTRLKHQHFLQPGSAGFMGTDPKIVRPVHGLSHLTDYANPSFCGIPIRKAWVTAGAHHGETTAGFPLLRAIRFWAGVSPCWGPR